VEAGIVSHHRLSKQYMLPMFAHPALGLLQYAISVSHHSNQLSVLTALYKASIIFSLAAHQATSHVTWRGFKYSASETGT